MCAVRCEALFYYFFNSQLKLPTVLGLTVLCDGVAAAADTHYQHSLADKYKTVIHANYLLHKTFGLVLTLRPYWGPMRPAKAISAWWLAAPEVPSSSSL